MNYELKADSPDILRSVHYFPGDEHIDPCDYEICAQERYLANVAIVVGAAERFGVDIDTETVERWKRGNILTNKLDTFLDESPDRADAHAQYMAGLSYFRGERDSLRLEGLDDVDRGLLVAITLMDNALEGVPAEGVRTLYGIAETMGDISQRKAECANIDEYIDLVTLEAELCALLLVETASDYVRKQPEFTSYEDWLFHALRVGTLRDAMRDLKKDKADGLTAVETDLPSRLRYKRATVRQARASLVQLVRHDPNRMASWRGLMAYHKFDKNR